MSDDRLSGKISRMLHAKGYGFIVDDQAHSWFFHAKEFVPQDEFHLLRNGMSVTFRKPRDGDRAEMVRRDL